MARTRFDGERLKAARLARGLTQKALGKAVGKHKSHISRYEDGQFSPGARSLGALANALGVGVEVFFSTNKRAGSNGRHDKSSVRPNGVHGKSIL